MPLEHYRAVFGVGILFALITHLITSDEGIVNVMALFGVVYGHLWLKDS